MTYLWLRKLMKMNKYIYVIVASITIAFSACAQKATNSTKTISYLSMERTACFGRCPSYMVEIYKNGLVRYTGRQFTTYLGVYERNIGTTKAKKILNEYAVRKVDTCKDVYENYIADLPGLMYSFVINGKKKEVINAGFGPKYFEMLSQDIDKIAQPGVGWKKVADLTPKKK